MQPSIQVAPGLPRSRRIAAPPAAFTPSLPTFRERARPTDLVDWRSVVAGHVFIGVVEETPADLETIESDGPVSD
jgi:hypothetical protein